MVGSIDNLGMYSLLHQDITKAQIELNRLNQQISSGRKLLNFSDDISAASRSMKLQEKLNKNDMFSKTISEMTSRLEVADNALSGIDDIIVSLKQTAIDMGDSGATTQMRFASAEVVSQELEALVDFANTSFVGQHLFSGFNSAQNPFEYSGNEIIFNGDANEIRAEISEGQFLSSTLDPNVIFGSLTVEKEGIDLNTKLSFGQGNFKSQATGAGTTTTIVDTSLIGATNIAAGMEVFLFDGTGSGQSQTISSFNAATGTITVDSPFTVASDATTEFSVSQGNPGTLLKDLETGFNGGPITITTTEFPNGTTVDLSTARTLSDAKKLIENVSSRLSVTLNAASNGLVVTDSAGTSMTIADVGSGTAAQELKINGTGAAGVITGGDINPKLTEDTLISDLAGALTDPLTLGSIYVDQGVRSGTIDLSSATTVRDVLSLINEAQTANNVDYELDAHIDSDSNSIVIGSRISGASFSISNASAGDTTSENLGLLTMTGTTTVGSLRNGKGLDTVTGADFNLNIGGVPTAIDLSGVATVQDIVDAINAQAGGAGYTASIDNVGPDNTIQITNAVAFSFSAGLSNAAQQLGFTLGTTAVSHDSADVAALEVNSFFTSVSDLLSGLQNDNQAEIILTEAGLDTGLDSVEQGRARIGGRINRLSLTNNFITDQNVYVTEDLIKNRDVDLTIAISEFQEAQVAFQAALAISNTVLQTSLINFL